jgi:poly-gamma-glutamate synthesis protein (capsule biosynthesis protein)
LIRISFIALLLSVPAALSSLQLLSQTREEEIVLRFGGDCLLVEHYERGSGLDVHRAFRNFDLLRTADLSMVNLECPITERGTRQAKPFTFRMHPRYVEALVSAGIDLVNVANNHIYDFGTVGLDDTMYFLDSAGVGHVGAGRHAEEAHRGVILEVKGKRLGFLGYYGGGEAPAASPGQAGVARRTLSVMVTDIRRLKETDRCDYVFVNLHWGVEKAVVPDPDQVKQARQLIDSGADVIVGHHPHVLQGVERYGSGIIAYSLGNLVFGGNSRHTYSTALLEITIGNQGLQHRIVPVQVVEWNLQQLDGPEAMEFVKSVEQLPIPSVEVQ